MTIIAWLFCMILLFVGMWLGMLMERNTYGWWYSNDGYWETTKEKI